jgi:hypothetical protein
MQANDMGGEDGVLLGVGMDGGYDAAEFKSASGGRGRPWRRTSLR